MLYVPLASNLNTDNSEPDSESSEWDKEKNYFNKDRLFGAVNPFEEKTLAEYQKGFHYGSNQAKLNEQMENAILKSEMYGEPSSLNQYRYYGGSNDNRKKRSNLRQKAIR